MDMLGQGRVPTFLDWMEKELVGLSRRRRVKYIGNAF